METTTLSSKGQVIIPKSLRTMLRWEPGLQLEVLDTKDGLLLKPKVPFEPTELKDVVRMFKGRLAKKSPAEIDAALTHELKKNWRVRG